MSVKVIELNDSNIKVGNEAGMLFQSPGFSLVTNDKVEVGEFAESQCRIQPTNSCLLYTSPSPRDKRQSRMPSSA